MMLIGRHQQPVPQFDRRPLLAFGNPLGVRLKQRKDFLGRRNLLLAQQPPIHPSPDVLVQHPVEVGQRVPMLGLDRLFAQTQQARRHFGRQLPARLQILAHRLAHPGFSLSGPAAKDGLARDPLQPFEPPPPVFGFAPVRQGVAELIAVFFNQSHALAPRVPQQIQVRGKMHVGFQDVGVHLERQRLNGRAFFFGTPPVPLAATNALIWWSSASSTNATLSRSV